MIDLAKIKETLKPDEPDSSFLSKETIKKYCNAATLISECDYNEIMLLREENDKEEVNYVNFLTDYHKKEKTRTKHIYQDAINSLKYKSHETITLEELKSVFNIAMISSVNFSTYQEMRKEVLK